MCLIICSVIELLKYSLNAFSQWKYIPQNFFEKCSSLEEALFLKDKFLNFLRPSPEQAGS